VVFTKSERIHKERLYSNRLRIRCRVNPGKVAVHLNLAFTRYCHHQYCMVYGIQTGGLEAGRIVRNGRAIVMQ